ncbi:MAG: hypothetical protein ACE5JH_10220 [Acidobacteriota bacterium]
MRGFGYCTVAAALLAFLVLAPAGRAQDEPSLFPETEDEPSLFPDEEQDEEETPPEEVIPAINPGPSIADPPLRKELDFARWVEMSGRERQAFVEGAVLALESFSMDLRRKLPEDGRTPPERMAALVQFVTDSYPKHPPVAFLREMDSIYRTARGQRLSMLECFLQAYRRLNLR